MEHFDYTVKWSARRRTLSLEVTTAGAVVVAAPVGTRPETIERVLQDRHGWITRKLAERREALDRIAPGMAYYLGRAYPVIRIENTRPEVRLAEDALYVTDTVSGDKAWLLLREWYQQEASGLLAARVRHYGRLMPHQVGRLEVRDWRRRWGECRPRDGRLRFNWRLVLLPLPILDYVVAHELTHLAVPGHPPRFWRRLARVMPDCQDRRSWLNRYGSPFLLWRLEV
ncbi:MAG: M48 family metallopeptidase [Deltaproteobacteria bacterium]|nr:M48 family metallopeptidase [Deltaproteobacteria bacterium]